MLNKRFHFRYPVAFTLIYIFSFPDCKRKFSFKKLLLKTPTQTSVSVVRVKRPQKWMKMWFGRTAGIHHGS